LKPGQWGSLSIQEKWQERKVCDKRQHNSNSKNGVDDAKNNNNNII
jgi:hypothetical protein